MAFLKHQCKGKCLFRILLSTSDSSLGLTKYRNINKQSYDSNKARCQANPLKYTTLHLE